MNKSKLINRIFLALILCTFSCIIIPINKLYAQGPSAPEAASFEPVDATDMVNLLTGDFTYVLPLLNIPSPEGGYPIALSYHAGIAVNQEASWVGLGWNLNPGSINRNINGYPDDWKQVNVNEFYYDRGWTDNYYSVSAGVSLYNNSVDVGLGLSWGSNKSLGGFVSLGYAKLGQYGVSGYVGTSGAGVGYGNKNGYSANVSTNGAGVGYGNFKLNYSFNSGLSGGVTSSTQTGNFSSGVGINFSSKGTNANIDINGAGTANAIGEVSSGDYDLDINGDMIFLNLYVFYINFTSLNFNYSLFKYNDLYTSGTLYPYASNQTKLSENGTPSWLLKERYFMDVNVFPKFENGFDYEALVNNDKALERNNLVLPSYDNYIVNAQGISGSIKPSSYNELNLSGRGRGETNPENLYAAYNTDNYQWPFDSNYLGGGIHFYFENAYNSFLRINRGNIYKPTYVTEASDLAALTFKTFNSYDYSEDYTPDGNKIKTGYRKREGNFVETFTNKQIRENNIVGFIEAKNLQRDDLTTFLDDGIGGYKISTLDGKIYHYSLPVYNYEMFYRNLVDKTDLDKKFFEIQKTTPYATHWLLTAITGPDYVDTNNDGKLDSDDYGYWVEFEYGKWTDGYGWKGPIDDYITIKGDEERYEFTWGRKQVYYLDAIKTRTHTALFVKELRKDAESNEFTEYENYVGNGDVDVLADVKKIESPYQLYPRDYPKAAEPGDKFFVVPFPDTNPIYEGWFSALYNDASDPNINASYYNWTKVPTEMLHDDGGNGTILRVDYMKGRKINRRYIDIPRNYSLALNKIVILKNKDVPTSIKSIGNYTNLQNYGKMFTSFSYEDISTGIITDKSGWATGTQDNQVGPFFNLAFFTENPENLKRDFEVNLHNNILDIEDIKNLGLESKAHQTIQFSYNYSLAKESVNSSNITKGRLTLEKLQIKGKEEANILPSYKFSYAYTNIDYNKDNRDAWGYHKNTPQAWSLNEITTPIGTKIKVNYESDDFHQQSAGSNRLFDKGLMFYLTAINRYNDIYLEVTNDLDNQTESIDNFQQHFDINSSVSLTNFFICRRENYGSRRREVKLHIENGIAEVVEVTSDRVKLKIPANVNYWSFDDQDEDWLVNRNWSKGGVYHSDGSSDGVIMRDPGENLCYEWRNAYNNSDISFYYTLMANSFLKDQREGGIRVKKIEVTDGIKHFNTNYYYNAPDYDKNQFDANYISSGITSYAPSDETVVIPYISEIPSPNVIYGNVTMENSNNNGDVLGKTIYQFETLETSSEQGGYIFSLGEAFRVNEEQNETFLNGDVQVNKYTIFDKLANIGRLKSVTTLNNKDHIISKTVNNYKQNLDNDGEIGVTQESYMSYKRVKKDNVNKYLIGSTSKVSYPSVLESTTTYQGSVTSTTHYDKHDFLTGQLLETRNYASDGTAFKTKTIPAYTIPEYSDNLNGYGMGSKVDDVTNKNMLSQQAATYIYLLNEATNEEKIIDIGITTWNNDWTYRNHAGDETLPVNNNEKIWRKHKSYSWKGDIDPNDGSYLAFNQTNDDGFNWGVGQNIVQANSKWKNVSTTTRYDHYSAPLETMDINGNFTATKMGDNDSKIMVVANAKYTEMYYSGAEYKISNTNYFDSEITANGRSLENAHTGKYSVKTGNNLPVFQVNLRANEHREGNYKISVWVDASNNADARININGSTKLFNGEKVFAGDWVQLNHYEELSSGSETIHLTSASSVVYFDDFRVYPVASSMTGYVYNEWDELWYIIGNNGLATRFEYDAAGRLIKTFTEIADDDGITGGFKKVSENRYNYKKQ